MPIEAPPLPEDPPEPQPERDTLEWFLDYYRAIIVRKVAGMPLAAAARPMVASGTSLLGIVKHLGYVERGWFQSGILGQTFDVPWTDDDPDADFRIEPDETVEGIVAWYEAQCQRARQIVDEAASLDVREVRDRDQPQRSLRWILTHLVEETARHAGQMDIIREQIDGATGD